VGNDQPQQRYRTTSLGSGFANTNFSQVLTDLAPGAYQFRAAASNSLGVVFGSVQGFNLGPTVQTLRASGLTQVAATLNGNVDPKGADSVAWFEFGFTTNYGRLTPPQAVPASNGAAAVTAVIAGLIPGVSYHFRAAASNYLGAAFGADQGFPRFAQSAYLKASNTGPTNQFGYAIAMSGDTLVVGAPFEDSIGHRSQWY